MHVTGPSQNINEILTHAFNNAYISKNRSIIMWKYKTYVIFCLHVSEQHKSPHRRGFLQMNPKAYKSSQIHRQGMSPNKIQRMTRLTLKRKTKIARPSCRETASS